MQEPNDLTPANRELERALKTVRPTETRFDPVAAAFAAGRRSARPNILAWKSAAAFALFAGIAGNVLIVHGRRPAPRTDIPEPVVTTAVYHPAAVSEQSLIFLQQAVREHGLAGLPAAHVPAARAVGYPGFLLAN